MTRPEACIRCQGSQLLPSYAAAYAARSTWSSAHYGATHRMERFRPSVSSSSGLRESARGNETRREACLDGWSKVAGWW